MFWINFEWLVFAKPYNFESDGDTIKLNKTSDFLWRNMPEKYRGMAITIAVILEND